VRDFIFFWYHTFCISCHKTDVKRFRRQILKYFNLNCRELKPCPVERLLNTDWFLWSILLANQLSQWEGHFYWHDACKFMYRYLVNIHASKISNHILYSPSILSIEDRFVTNYSPRNDYWSYWGEIKVSVDFDPRHDRGGGKKMFFFFLKLILLEKTAISSSSE